MRKITYRMLKWLPLVIAVMLCWRAAFFLCGVPRPYSTPKSMPDGSPNPLFDVQSLVDNLRNTMMNDEKANVALGMAILLLGLHILIMHIETQWQNRSLNGDGGIGVSPENKK